MTSDSYSSLHPRSDDPILCFWGYGNSFELRFLDEDSESEVPIHGFPFSESSINRVLGFSNTSVIYHTSIENNIEVCVYNPTLGASFLLPSASLNDREFSGRPLMGVAMKYNSNTCDDYELLYLAPISEWSNYYNYTIYSSKENQWKVSKKLDVGPRNICIECPVVCGDVVYWASDCGPATCTPPYVLSFNIEKETSQILSLPIEATCGILDSDYYEFAVAEWGEDSLCLIRCDRLTSSFKLWAFKKGPDEFGSGSGYGWVKIHEARFEPVESGMGKNQVHSFTLVNSNMLIFTLGSWIYGYRLDGEVVLKFGSHKQSWYPKLILISDKF